MVNFREEIVVVGVELGDDGDGLGVVDGEVGVFIVELLVVLVVGVEVVVVSIVGVVVMVVREGFFVVIVGVGMVGVVDVGVGSVGGGSFVGFCEGEEIG